MALSCNNRLTIVSSTCGDAVVTVGDDVVGVTSVAADVAFTTGKHRIPQIHDYIRSEVESSANVIAEIGSLHFMVEYMAKISVLMN